MNRDTLNDMNAREMEQAIALLQSQFPALAGRDVRLRAILEPMAARIAGNTRAHELLGLRTAEDMAAAWGVKTRRAQAFIAALHERFGVGRRIGNMWVLSAYEAERYRPSERAGRPRKS